MREQRRNTVGEQGISKRTDRRGPRGFTLVELLVVIAIIALLMAILMPALRRVKMQAEEVSCRSNLRQVGLIIYMYLQENDFKMPKSTGWSNGASNEYRWYDPGDGHKLKPWEPDSYWGTAYWDYIKETKIFGCPTFKNACDMIPDLKLYSYDVKDFYDSSLGLNGYLSEVSTNSIRAQGDVIIATDHIEPRNEQAHQGNRGDMFCQGNGTENLTHYKPPENRQDWYRAIFRHSTRNSNNWQTGGRANMLWLDNHVSVQEETKGHDIPSRYYDPTGKHTWSGP